MNEEIEKWLKNPNLQVIGNRLGFHTTCGISDGTFTLYNTETNERFELEWMKTIENGELIRKFPRFPKKLEYIYEI